MDIAISLSSSIQEISDKNPLIKKKSSSTRVWKLAKILWAQWRTLWFLLTVGTDAKIQGFGPEQAESILYLLPNANRDFTKLLISGVMYKLHYSISDITNAKVLVL